jgi:hypothetical protein
MAVRTLPIRASHVPRWPRCPTLHNIPSTHSIAQPIAAKGWTSSPMTSTSGQAQRNDLLTSVDPGDSRLSFDPLVGGD